MKIAVLQDDFPPENTGGAGIVAYQLAVGLKERGHDVFIITTTVQEEDESVNYQGLRVYRLRCWPFGFWRFYFCLFNLAVLGKVKKILQKEKPEVVHCHNLQSALSYHCLSLAKKNAKKVFLTAHDTMLFTYGKLATGQYLKNFDYHFSILDQIKQAGKRYNPLRNILIRHYLKRVDKIFAVSHSLRQALNTNGIDNVEVIYNGVRTDDFQTAEAEVAQFKKQNNLENKKIIFFGGRVSKPKGAEQILEAMPLIKNKITNAVLLIAGAEDNYLDYLKRKSCQLAIKEDVVFLRTVPHHQMKIIYTASQIVVVPSIYLDPFNLFNIEAMACKKPVVGTCYGGTPEIISDGETGYIVNPLRLSELAGRIIQLLSNENLSASFGKRGFERAKEEFSLEKQVNNVLQRCQGF